MGPKCHMVRHDSRFIDESGRKSGTVSFIGRVVSLDQLIYHHDVQSVLQHVP
jgi:hypothetical protein